MPYYCAERCGPLLNAKLRKGARSKPFFKCTCSKCVRVYGLNRKRERTVARGIKIRLRYFLRRFR